MQCNVWFWISVNKCAPHIVLAAVLFWYWEHQSVASDRVCASAISCYQLVGQMTLIKNVRRATQLPAMQSQPDVIIMSRFAQSQSTACYLIYRSAPNVNFGDLTPSLSSTANGSPSSQKALYVNRTLTGVISRYNKIRCFILWDCRRNELKTPSNT